MATAIQTYREERASARPRVAIAESIVVGAGSAGLRVAHALVRCVVGCLVVDRKTLVGDWRGGYGEHGDLGDELRASGWVESSHGFVSRRGPGRAAIHSDVEVVRIDPCEGGWQLTSSDGKLWAPHVVLATGAPAAAPRRAARFPRQRPDEQRLPSLVSHLDVLDRDGAPRVHGARTLDHARGLYFLGYRAAAEGGHGATAFDARAIAREVMRDLYGTRSELA